MIDNSVVIQFKDGSVMKGYTGDFLPNRDRFHLNGIDGTVREIVVEELKAVFFVKDIQGNRDYRETYDDVIPGGGRKVEVEFNDGEKITGYVLVYSPDRQGFIMLPADLNGNNERIFVVNSATRNITFLPSPDTVCAGRSFNR